MWGCDCSVQEQEFLFQYAGFDLVAISAADLYSLCYRYVAVWINHSLLTT